jgi:hypothetical protein
LFSNKTPQKRIFNAGFFLKQASPTDFRSKDSFEPAAMSLDNYLCSLQSLGVERLLDLLHLQDMSDVFGNPYPEIIIALNLTQILHENAPLMCTDPRSAVKS